MSAGTNKTPPLGPDILLEIIDVLAHRRWRRTLANLQSTSRAVYTLTTPALYHTVKCTQRWPHGDLFSALGAAPQADVWLAFRPVAQIAAEAAGRHALDLPALWRWRLALARIERLELHRESMGDDFDPATGRMQALFAALPSRDVFPNVKLIVDSSYIYEKDLAQWQRHMCTLNEHSPAPMLGEQLLQHTIPRAMSFDPPSDRWESTSGRRIFEWTRYDRVCVHGIEHDDVRVRGRDVLFIQFADGPCDKAFPPDSSGERKSWMALVNSRLKQLRHLILPSLLDFPEWVYGTPARDIVIVNPLGTLPAWFAGGPSTDGEARRRDAWLARGASAAEAAQDAELPLPRRVLRGFQRRLLYEAKADPVVLTEFGFEADDTDDTAVLWPRLYSRPPQAALKAWRRDICDRVQWIMPGDEAYPITCPVCGKFLGDPVHKDE